MKKSIILVITTLLLCGAAGCQGQTVQSTESNIEVETDSIIDETAIVTASVEENEQLTEENLVTDNEVNDENIQEESQITPVTVMVINMTNVDIGMFSIIDPASKEQLQISKLDQSSSITIDINWPKDESELDWALYNKNGELCIEGSSDLSGMTESATIVFSGDGNVDTVEVDIK